MSDVLEVAWRARKEMRLKRVEQSNRVWWLRFAPNKSLVKKFARRKSPCRAWRQRAIIQRIRGEQLSLPGLS
jgi:hypothetical protein